MALHSSGLQNQSKRLYRDEMSRLIEQEQQLLRQENERLRSEVHNIKGDLVQSREKVSATLQQSSCDNVLSRTASSPDTSPLCAQVHRLDATIVSLKQHKHKSQSSLVKALEQENAFLKQELEAQKELTKVSAE